MQENYLANVISAWIPTLSLELPYIGVTDLTAYVVALVIFVLLTSFFWLLRRVVINHLNVLSQKTSFKSDDVIVEAVENIHSVFYTITALYFSLQVLPLSAIVLNSLAALFYVALTWQAIRIISGFIKHIVEAKLQDETDQGEIDPNAVTAAEMVTLLSKVALWTFGILFVLSNLGIEVTSLIAGLGIGGVAVAFALQGILSDLFASFSLYFDKPFRIGDFIVIGSDAGTVEKIGIKSTRIRTLQGEELVVSNAELTTARVQNFKKMEKRRIVTSFGVTYDTEQTLLRQIKGFVTDIFTTIEGAALDRVHFTTFGDSALQYEVVYFVSSSEYTEFLRVQEEFNHALFEKFAERGIEFAYPTQTIYTKSS
jgi:small-conductance mechanosensitive channel